MEILQNFDLTSGELVWKHVQIYSIQLVDGMNQKPVSLIMNYYALTVPENILDIKSGTNLTIFIHDVYPSAMNTLRNHFQTLFNKFGHF